MMRSPGCRLILGCLSLLAAQRASAGGTVAFIGDGAGLAGPQIAGVSGDGRIAAGQDLLQAGFRAGVGGDVTALPGFPLPANGRVTIGGLSRDGGVVVGQARTAAGTWEAFRNTEAPGSVALGTLPGAVDSAATATSGDGSLVVGFSDSEAFVWTAASGMTLLPGGPVGFSAAWDVSGDGSRIVGADSNGAFSWTAATGRLTLPLPPGDEGASAAAISRDGGTVVGSSFDEETLTSQAIRWTAAGAVGLGRPAGTTFASAHGVSAGGDVIIGTASGEGPGGAPLQVSFVWTKTTGLLTFADYLLAQGVDGSALLAPLLTGVSDDGRIFVGYDDDPSQVESFIVALSPAVPAAPAPARLAVFALLVALGGRIAIRRERGRERRDRAARPPARHADPGRGRSSRKSRAREAPAPA